MKEIKRIDTPKITNPYKQLKRVAAYARVSTKQELQASSIDLQIRHYTKEIIFNPDYIFAGIYADHGKSGTSMKKRDGFQELLKKIKAGYIDLVLVKSLSRFARNTLDALTVIQETRKLGVEFFFEKENISSLDTTIDMILTMMAGMAEAESESMSQNIRWGYEKRAQKGQVSVRKAIGYDITKDKTYSINEHEANAVRTLFQMKLEGRSNTEMIAYFNIQGITTTKDNKFASTNQINHILRDERYIGKMTYGKSYVKVINQEKVTVANNGEKPKYIISNHHESIIDPITYGKVQQLLEKNKNHYYKKAHNESNFTHFVYSMKYNTYLYRTKDHSLDTNQNVLGNDYFRNLNNPGLYVRDVTHVLKRATNALGRNFSELEAKFDKHVNKLLIKDELDYKLKTTGDIITSYKNEYYALMKKGLSDSADIALFHELENQITKFSMEYIDVEDEYIEYEQAFKQAEKIKNAIISYDYPIQELTTDIVKSIFSNIVIINSEKYVIVINVKGKELTPDELKKAATAKPLLHSRCKSKVSSSNISWSIVLE